VFSEGGGPPLALYPTLETEVLGWLIEAEKADAAPWFEPLVPKTGGGPTGFFCPSKSHPQVLTPPFSATGGPVQPGPQLSCSIGRPIRCVRAFTAREAVARAESQPDEDTDTELDPPSLRSPGGDPAASQILERPSDPSCSSERSPAARLTKTQKRNLKARELRRKERGLGADGLKSCAQKYRESAKGSGINVGTDSNDLPRSKPGWIGLREVEDDRRVYGLVELQETFGLKLFPWDGK
jgi:hypothetical protein